MTEELIIAGFGGQGVLSMGKILCYSGLMQNLEVSWYPSYGPEMRGGTANVTVIISDTVISSPVLNECDTAIILNQQALDKFESAVKKGGLLLYDSSGITRPPVRSDIKCISFDASTEALNMGSLKIYNMLVLGAYLKLKPVVNQHNIQKGLEKSLPHRHHHLIPLNMKAIQKGAEIVSGLVN